MVIYIIILENYGVLSNNPAFFALDFNILRDYFDLTFPYLSLRIRLHRHVYFSRLVQHDICHWKHS